MQTRPYGELFKLVQSLAGVDAFAPSETDDIANFINRRLYEAYTTSQMWPRYLVPNEPRTVGAFSAQGATAPEGVRQVYALDLDPINDKNAYTGVTDARFTVTWNSTLEQWEVKESATVIFINTEATDSPSQVSESWTAVNAGAGDLLLNAGNYIPYTQAGRANTIAEFIRIHRRKAFVNQSAWEYEFYLTFEGAQILNIGATNTETHEPNSETVAFVTYKLPYTELTTANNYTTSTEPVPAEFFNFLAHCAYADFLRLDGQTDKALVEEQRGRHYLDLELEKVDIISNNNTINQRITTYVNMQAR